MRCMRSYFSMGKLSTGSMCWMPAIFAKYLMDQLRGFLHGTLDILIIGKICLDEDHLPAHLTGNLLRSSFLVPG